MGRFLVPAVILAIAAVTVVAILLRGQERIPIAVSTRLSSGSIVGSSEVNAAYLALERLPKMPARIVPVNDNWQPEMIHELIGATLDSGVRFIITSHPSNCAVAISDLFTDGRALQINTASTTTALSGCDDFVFRLIPELCHEQRSIAGRIREMGAKRLLLVQATENLAYTEPAFTAFAKELGAEVEVVRLTYHEASLDAQRLKEEMPENFDTCYILAGSYRQSIGIIAQLVHMRNPAARIMLTPWTRSSAIVEAAGPAVGSLIVPSIYPSRHADPRVEGYLRAFRKRFGYEPISMSMSVTQAMELLAQAFAAGHTTPQAVRDFFLGAGDLSTSFGPLSFDANGDVRAQYHFIEDIRREYE